MMRLFANLDVYKAIILAGLVLLPAAGAWAYYEHGRLEEGRRAIAVAQGRDGDVERIALRKKEVEAQVLNEKKSIDVDDPRVYFERIIYGAVDRSKGEPLKKTDFQINPSEQSGSMRAAGSNQRLHYKDTLVDLDFKRNGREAFPIPRDYLNAVMFNAESQQRRWKLRELSVRNKTILELGSGKAPPPQVDDDWVVQKLTFVWRQQTRTQ
jgi:hypothetical protein